MWNEKKILRVFPSAVGLFMFSLIVFLYKFSPLIYANALKCIGIKPWSYPFLDGGYMYEMKHSWLHGVNIYMNFPGQVVPGTGMSYSPLWPRLPLLPSDPAARAPIGLATDLLLLVSIGWLPPAQTYRDAILLSLATISTMVCFALERNNVDVWIYLLIFAGVMLFSARFRYRCISYAFFLFAGMLKYYPMILLLMALRERSSRFWVIVFGVMAGLILFVLGFWKELHGALQNVPKGRPDGDMIGIVNIPLMLSIFPEKAEKEVIAGVLCRLCLTAGVLFSACKLAARPNFAASLARLPDRCSVWLVVGCLVMGGCYFSIQNVGYRGIFLLPVLSGLLAVRQVTGDAPLREEFGRVTYAIVVIMWMEGIRFWVASLSSKLGSSPAIGFDLVIWLTREVMWLYLARMMTAVVMNYIAQSPMGRSWYNHFLLFRKASVFES